MNNHQNVGEIKETMRINSLLLLLLDLKSMFYRIPNEQRLKYLNDFRKIRWIDDLPLVKAQVNPTANASPTVKIPSRK